VYFVYGLHFCANISCLPDGEPGAVLLRGAEVISDLATARLARPTARCDADLARGPARLATLLGLRREHNGLDITDPASPVRLLPGDPIAAEQVRTGPRVGVAAAQDRPWRFWVAGSPAVSAYRRRPNPPRRRRR
jgi:DNA-3-methyladenine glycosylase